MNEIERALKDIKNNRYTDHGIARRSMDIAIKTLEKQLNNGWISCSRRLPTDEENKLYRGEFIIQTKDCELPYVALWNRIKGIWQDDYEELDDVIAWQPLPDKYKK